MDPRDCPNARQPSRRGCPPASDRIAAARPAPDSGRRSTSSWDMRWNSTHIRSIHKDHLASRAILVALPAFTFRCCSSRLEPRLDRSVLRIELGQVRTEILYDLQMGQRQDSHIIGDVIDALGASARIAAVAVHVAISTYPLPPRPRHI